MGTVSLRLAGLLVRTLDDNGHLPDHADLVGDDDPDRVLHRAAGRWYSGCSSRRVGLGWQYRGPCTGADASTILNYLESVAGALSGPGVDAEVRAEGRRLGAALEAAVRSLRQSGATVVERPVPVGTEFDVRAAEDRIPS
jgi:hypothetical protein